MLQASAIGNIGNDAVVKEINGKKVINFSIAHTEKYKDATQVSHERTTWVECEYWTDSAAVAAYLKKGTQVYVQGTPTVQSWTNKQGVAAATFRLRVGMVQLLGSKKEDANTPPPPIHNAQPAFANNGEVPGEVPDDLPF